MIQRNEEIDNLCLFGGEFPDPDITESVDALFGVVLQADGAALVGGVFDIA